MLVFFLFVGLVVGSYANSLVYRLGNGRRVLEDPRSYCPHCRHTLGWFDLIPLLSFLFLLGTCRYCRKPISIQYPLVESAMAILFAWSAHALGADSLAFFSSSSLVVGLLVSWIAVFSFMVFFVVDLRYLVIPDELSLPLIVLAFGGNLYLQGPEWKTFLFAGILGAVFFALQYFISKGTWVGGGDIRLGALLGVLLGIERLAVALVLAYVSGMVVALILLGMKKASLKTAVPFGVFLMMGGFISFFFGTGIVDWYVNELPNIFSSVIF